MFFTTAMVLSLYLKQRILSHYCDGFTTSNKIKKLLEEEEVYISRATIWKFLHHYNVTECLGRKESSGRPSKITPEVKLVVERKMEQDDETTAHQLHKMLTDKGYTLSLATILWCRKELGWTFRGIDDYTYVTLHTCSHSFVSYICLYRKCLLSANMSLQQRKVC